MGLPKTSRVTLVSTLAVLISASALAAPTTLSTALTGSATTKGGDPDASGGFTASLDPDTHDFCYTLWATKIAKPGPAHLHAGAAGTSGAVVATLDITGKTDELCIALAKDKLQAILDNPTGFYVDVHSADFPEGAIRGQISR